MKYLIAAFMAGFSFHVYSGSIWGDFLSLPDNFSLEKITEKLGGYVHDCDSDRAPDKNERSKLYKLIGRGSESAFRASFLVSKCRDGGDIEVCYRSTGMLFEARPNAFLQISKESGANYSNVGHMLTMLPLDNVDNIPKRISTIEKRIEILESVRDADLIALKEYCLDLLKKDKTILIGAI